MSGSSAIAIFPFQNDYENNCLARATTINDTLLSAIRAYLVTPRGSRLGNMVGSFLPDIINDLIGINDLTGLAERLKSDLNDQFVGVNFINVSMTLDFSNNFVDLILQITFSTNYTNLQQLNFTFPTNISTSN